MSKRFFTLETLGLSVAIAAYRFGRHQDGEDGALSSQVSQEKPPQLHRQQGRLGAREGLQDHLHPCGELVQSRQR